MATDVVHRDVEPHGGQRKEWRAHDHQYPGAQEAEHKDNARWSVEDGGQCDDQLQDHEHSCRRKHSDSPDPNVGGGQVVCVDLPKGRAEGVRWTGRSGEAVRRRKGDILGQEDPSQQEGDAEERTGASDTMALNPNLL